MKRPIEEVSKLCGISYEVIITFIENEWIIPEDKTTNLLDDEDLARTKLIRELKEDFEVNNEAIPIILNLIDQINLMQLELKKWHA